IPERFARTAEGVGRAAEETSGRNRSGVQSQSGCRLQESRDPAADGVEPDSRRPPLSRTVALIPSAVETGIWCAVHGSTGVLPDRYAFCDTMAGHRRRTYSDAVTFAGGGESHG